MLIDSHCHLDRLVDNDQPGALQPVLDAAKARGVEKFLCVSVSEKGYERMKNLAMPHPEVVISCGVHPLDIKDGFDPAWLAREAADEKVVAIGETGLDYYYSQDNVKDQQAAFSNHIELANRLNKPVIIHTRDAREDTLGIWRESQGNAGVLHCFTESWEMARDALDLGLYISISGIVTFRNAEALRDVVRKVPMDRLLVETDSPYLAPVPYRGKTNQPAYVHEVAQFVADLKQVRYEELLNQTAENFFRLFPAAR
ncbi:TatD family hydrolase [Ferrimonas balearica]|uniref:TatD family hydrolase n=1 Tax=Ferrimonas balearica TaxID=44012 RepID=UPI001C99B4FA|nr:YchF/TatD family DNA exonuclease [Ferrimonas balearica]MBY5920462.1 YchF/TatD family DNA exonuclease [Ferrimonas balearica]MBY5996853.1 YchF/TatD family DNA exonuclease [Ferrimonas balearica]